MARGKEVLPAAASIEFRYHHVADMPWAKIEAASGKSFNSEERKEIFFCAEGFDWEYSYLSKAPPLKEVNALREKLLRFCGALVELGEQYPAGSCGDEQEAARDTVSAVQIYFGTDKFCFRDEYKALARAAHRMREGLEKRPPLEADTLSSTPETAGLRAFLSRVLDEAEVSQARATPPGSWVEPGYEYRRWGLAIGPRAKRFPEFVGAVLGRKVTEGMLRKAWPQP
ncbi:MULTISPECIES: hypothetical protein [unclassified Roseovarius]|uniref:hypothetical protein n=1 Tax=unclassified Roseovarius TaxID=2614913 RepID=UPI00273E4239|nr:hypothetical protein [Roseovarius sp. MMSF_3350]